MNKILWILFFIAWTISFILWIIAIISAEKNNSFVPLSYPLATVICSFGMIFMRIL